MSTERWVARAWPWVAALLIGLLAAQPLGPGVISRQVDGELHVVRLAQFYDVLRHGILVPRWAPDMAYGYGYPVFNYYAPLLYYVASIPVALGAPHTSAIAWTAALAWVLAAVAAFGLFRALNASDVGALAGALAYAFSPYLVRNILFRGAVAEHLGLALLPFLIWVTLRLVRDPRRLNAIAFVLALTALQLAHNISALFAVPVVAWLASFEAFRLRMPWRVVLIGGLAILSTCLSAFYWLSAWLERDLVHLERVVSDWARFDRNFLQWHELLLWFAPQDVLMVRNSYAPMSLGPWLTGLGCAGALCALPVRQLRATVVALLIIFGFATFMVLPQSSRIWEILPIVQFAQFPWRWLGVASLAICGLIATGATVLVSALRTRLSRQLFSLALALVTLLLLPYQHVINDLPSFKSFAPRDILVQETTTGMIGSTAGNEYLPKTVQRMPEATNSPLMRADRMIAQGASVVEVEQPFPLAFKARIRAPMQERLHIQQFAFPGWQARLDGAAVPLFAAGEHATLHLDVPPGEHTLELWMQPTQIQQLGTGVSLAGVLAGLLALAFSRRKLAARVLTPHAVPDAAALAVFCATLAGVLLLKALLIDHSGSWFRPTRFDGATVAGVEQPQAINFANKIRLLGFDMPRLSKDRSTLTVPLYWQIIKPQGDEVTTVVHIIDQAGQRVAQSDHYSPVDYATTRWSERMYASDVHVLELPATLPPGSYRLSILTHPRDRAAESYRIVGVASGETTAFTVQFELERPPPQPAGASTLAQPLQVSSLQLPTARMFPRDRASIGLAWRSTTRQTTDLRFELWLRQGDRDARLLADAEPVPGYPTSQWNEGASYDVRYMVRMPSGFDAAPAQIIARLSDGRHIPLGMLELGRRDVLIAPPERALDVAFGDTLLLSGVDTRSDEAGFTLRLAWRALGETDRDVKVSLRLIDLAGAQVFVEDRVTGNWQRPSSGWLIGEQIEDRFVLPREILRACDCKVNVLVYDATTGENLRTSNGESLLTLIDVVPQVER